MDIKEIGKRILQDALSILPYTPFIVVEWTRIENDKKFKEIEGEIKKIWEAIGKFSWKRLEVYILRLFKLLEDNNLLTTFNFRLSEACIGLAKEINNKSKLAQPNDPVIEYNECVKIIKNKIKDKDTKVEEQLRLIVYELERKDLIHKHADVNSPLGFHAISPKEYFFCRTDSIFQDWNPQEDAKEIVRFLINSKKNSISIEKLDAHFGWGPRRLNSAIAFLHKEKLIHKDYNLGGIKYILPRIRLSEEAHFFLKEENQ